MEFEKALSLRFWINLGRREDRRHETKARLVEAGVTAERFAAVDANARRSEAGNRRSARDLRQTPYAKVEGGPTSAAAVRGYESAGRYALALTQRLAIREARRRGAPAVLLMEDDVVFHPNFRFLIESVEQDTVA